MDLYLVRHAIAGEHDPVAWPDDSQRPLTPKGIRRFRQAARGLREIVGPVDLVLSSPFVRAWDTAKILTKEARWPRAIDCDALAVGQSPQAVLDALQEHAATTSIALVGHEPNLSELASFLTTGDPERVQIDLKKGGVIYLSLPLELHSEEADSSDEEDYDAGLDEMEGDEDESHATGWEGEDSADDSARDGPSLLAESGLVDVAGHPLAAIAEPDEPTRTETDDDAAPRLRAGTAQLRWVITPRVLREL